MLIYLSIHQFALVEQLELDFSTGMTVITGETGAGKSILLDALGLTLGQRAEAGMVRKGANRADVSSAFRPGPKARQWMLDHDIPDEEDQVILRRIISNEGRSRGYINGRTVSASDLREFSQHLIEVHSQHAHQRLLDKSTPRRILDAFGQLKPLARQVNQEYKDWQALSLRLKTLQESDSETRAKRQLLGYKVEELRELALGETELDELELEHKRLANAESMLMGGQQALSALTGDESGNDGHASQLTYSALQHITAIEDSHPQLAESKDLIEQAHILINEAGNSLQQYLEQVDINPHRLHQVEQRLSDIFSMARKHQLQPPLLYQHWQEQEQALAEIDLSDEGLDALREEVQNLRKRYLESAGELSRLRQQAGQQLDKEVCDHFDSMALGKARFFTQIEPLGEDSASAHGIDAIQFMVQTNPGMPAGPLGKVASGGELSRISLAIQVVTAATSDVSTMIFDEVDVGIGGGTAERVGRLMRQLSLKGQVMCVTHQPQVAAQAHQHMLVSKISGDEQTHTQIRELSANQRSEELARMLGGVEITQQTLEHASEMLRLAQA